MSASGSALPRTEAILRRGIADGLHLGAQMYVSWRGKQVASLAVGERGAGEPMTEDTLLLWLSAGKPLTAIAVARQVETGALSLDDPVGRHIPEFAAAGKEGITVRHLLTHTSGFSPPDPLPERSDWSEILAAICAAPVDSGAAPGTVAAYQPQAGWYVLAEIVQRLTGRPFAEHLRESVLLPFGMSETWVGMPEDQYRNYGPRIGTTHITFPGPPVPHPLWDSLEACRACRPGGNARGPVADLGRFYEGLLAGGRSVIRESTVREFTRRHRAGLFDGTFRHIVDFGLGFILNSGAHGLSTVPYGYGDFAGPDTFGHSGSQCSCAFADPGTGLVVAWCCNGQPGEVRHQRRQRALNSAIHQDLGLAAV